MYDTHTHLNTPELFPERSKYLDLFLEVGGKGLVNAGASEDYNILGLRIAQEAKISHPDLWIKMAIGWHPLEVQEKKLQKSDFPGLMRMLSSRYDTSCADIVAIGETGIDQHYQRDEESLAFQQELFALHADFAQEKKLPLVIHSRDEFPATLDILKNYRDLTIYFHCWGYGPEEYRILREQFPKLFIGFCANVTYKKAENLRDTLAIIDREQLVLETDAPYLSPQDMRGQLNHPANIRFLYAYVAEQLALDEKKLRQDIEKNVKRLYGF